MAFTCMQPHARSSTTHLLPALLLELDHAAQPAQGRHAGQQPAQLGVRRHVGLHEDGGLGAEGWRRAGRAFPRRHSTCLLATVVKGQRRGPGLILHAFFCRRRGAAWQASLEVVCLGPCFRWARGGPPGCTTAPQSQLPVVLLTHVCGPALAGLVLCWPLHPQPTARATLCTLHRPAAAGTPPHCPHHAVRTPNDQSTRCAGLPTVAVSASAYPFPALAKPP